MSPLIEQGFCPTLGRELIANALRQSAAAGEDWRSYLIQSLVARMRFGDALSPKPDCPQVVAFVGPTGVGKTTALAKLASDFSSRRGCQVGLVSLDTLRLGAVDQLLYFAEQISAPLEVVSSGKGLGAALQRLRDCQLILVDTAGGAPSDRRHKQNLTACLRVARPDATYLVASASNSSLHLANSLKNFAEVGLTHLLLSKLDEAAGLAVWLPTLFAAQLPLSYLTLGRSLSQGVFQANQGRLVKLLLGQFAEQ
jgi:flagellar biosynthesis protein FlhF